MVFFTEVGKYLLSLALLAVQTGPKGMVGEFTSQVVRKPRETMLLALPASLYVLQNNLLILALTNLDAGTYQVSPAGKTDFPNLTRNNSILQLAQISLSPAGESSTKQISLEPDTASPFSPTNPI